jgi:hypothetical protein
LLSIGNWLSRETVLVGLVRLGKEQQGERKNPEFCRGFFHRECYLFGGHKVVDFWIEREGNRDKNLVQIYGSKAVTLLCFLLKGIFFIHTCLYTVF